MKRSEYRLHYGMPILSLDLETTDSDKHASGIVQYGLAIQTHPDARVRLAGSLVNAEQAIEPGAAAVHGITEAAKRTGMPPKEALDRIIKSLLWAEKHAALIVAFNAQFDWTVLTMNALRYQIHPHPARFLTTSALFDPLVVSRHLDKYRKGGHTLELLTEAYGIEDLITSVAASHNAMYDAEAALLMAREQLGAFETLENVTHLDCTQAMMRWYAQWADEYEAYLERTGKPHKHILRAWPMVPPPV